MVPAMAAASPMRTARTRRGTQVRARARLALVRLQARSYDLQDLSGGRQHTEERERSSIYHRLPIDRDLELAVAAMNHVDIDAELTTHSRRHPGGVKTGDSVRTEADGYASH